MGSDIHMLSEYGISVPVLQTPFCKDTSCGIAKFRLFSQAMFIIGESLVLGSFFIRVSDGIIESLSFTKTASVRFQIKNEQI